MKNFIFALLFLLQISYVLDAQTPAFVKRTLSEISVKPGDLSGADANYKPIFGIGDSEPQALKGITRFGYLTVDSGGVSDIVKYENEEQVIYIVEGTGNLQYENTTVPVAKNDFIYIPVGVKHGLSNPRERSLKVIVMGFKIPDVSKISQTPRIMIANSDEVLLQILGQHGPTTQFKLLMGATDSKRDRLAAAFQVNSLFIMDFAAGGTNIPHRHAREEEIYFVLRGSGEMVAGETTDKKEVRYPAKEGDAFFFAPNTLIGFYSGTKEGEEHALILAVRSKFNVPNPGNR